MSDDSGWQQRIKDLNSMTPEELAAEKVEFRDPEPPSQPQPPSSRLFDRNLWTVVAMVAACAVAFAVFGALGGGSSGDSTDDSDAVTETWDDSEPTTEPELDEDVVRTARECIDGGYGSVDECLVGAVIVEGHD